MSSGLQQLQVQIKAVANIKKLTNSMKAVASSRLVRAQKILKSARVLGEGSNHFYDATHIDVDASKIRTLVVATTSDRGLCGSLHARVCKVVREIMIKRPANYDLVCLGEKSKGILRWEFLKNICLVVNGVGLKHPVFLDASLIAENILSRPDYIYGKLVFSKFQSLVASKLTTLRLYAASLMKTAPELYPYEAEVEDLQSYVEFSTAALVYFALCENFASELAFRVNVMSNASKNAGEMLVLLRQKYNRTRQAAVTRELIDIVSGANYIK